MNFATFEEFESAVLRAEANWEEGDWLGARRGYFDLVTRRLADLCFESAALQDADLLVIERLADLSVPFGDMEAVDDLLAAVATLYERQGAGWRADYVTLKRVHLALAADRIDDALKLLREGIAAIGDVEAIPFDPARLPGWESTVGWPTQGPLFPCLYLELGMLLAALGQYRQALIAFDRGLFHANAGTAETPLTLAAAPRLRLERAAAHLACGELDETEAALANDDIDAQRHPSLAARRHELLGKARLQRGALAEAQQDFRQVVNDCASQSMHRGTLRAMTNLAHIWLLLNRLGEAQGLLQAAADGAAVLGDHALGRRAQLLRRLAGARAESLLGTDSAPSVSFMQGAISPASLGPLGTRVEEPLVVSRGSDYLAYFEDRAVELQWELSAGRLGVAASVLGDMRADFDSCDSPLIHLRLRVLGAMLAYYDGVTTGAIEPLREAEATLEECRIALQARGLRSELYQVQRFLGWCWARLGHSQVERDALTAASQELLATMARDLAPDERATYLVNKWVQNEESLSLQIDRLVELGAAIARAPSLTRWWLRWRRLRELNALVDQIYFERESVSRRALDDATPLPAARRPTPLWRRLLLHSRRRATLAFLALPSRMFVARLGWMSLDFSVAPLTRVHLRSTVARWQRGLVEGDPEAARRAAAALAAGLGVAAHLKELPSRVTALTIVADDVLHGFPFAALPVEEGYLVDRYAVAMAYSCRPWRRARGGGTPLLAAVTKAVGKHAALPDAASQVREVSAWLHHRHVVPPPVIDENPRAAAILARLPATSFLHVVCHGTFCPDDPDATGIVLVGDHDGSAVLSLRRMSQVTMSRLRHATVVACWGADNYLLPGQWVIGLPQVLLRAGAESALACLWEVESTVGWHFVRCFYEHLAALPRDEALRRTQIEFLASPETRNPIWWAGFQLYGRADRLRI